MATGILNQASVDFSVIYYVNKYIPYILCAENISHLHYDQNIGSGFLARRFGDIFDFNVYKHIL